MTRKAIEDQYLLQQQLATDYGMKLNLGGINFLASPPPSAFSTSSFVCSPSSLSFSRSSSFSYGSVDSLQDYQPYITSSPYHSSNASLFSPSFYSSTTPWHDVLPSPPPSSFSTFDYSYEAYEPTRPFTNLTDNKVIRPFAPPTAKLDEMLDRFVQQEVPWAGVVTTRDNWYPINDITNMGQGERHLLEMFDNSQDARNGGKIKSEKYKTEMCRSWEEQGSCRYDSKCQYAHGQEELRSVERHPRYKTELCRSYYQTGSCRYAKRCVFLHSPPSEGKSDNGEVATQAPVPLLSRVGRSVTQKNTCNNSKSPLDFWSSIRKGQCSMPEHSTLGQNPILQDLHCHQIPNQSLEKEHLHLVRALLASSC